MEMAAAAAASPAVQLIRGALPSYNQLMGGGGEIARSADDDGGGGDGGDDDRAAEEQKQSPRRFPLRKRDYAMKAYVVCVIFCVVVINIVTVGLLDAIDSQALKDFVAVYRGTNCTCTPDAGSSE
jgi:hypothetical protein